MATNNNVWDDFEPEDYGAKNKTAGQWDDFHGGDVTPQEQQPPRETNAKTLAMGAFEKFKEFLHGPVEDTGQFIEKIPQNLAAGASKIGTEIVGFGLEQGENFANNLINIGNDFTDMPRRPHDNTLSDWVRQQGDEAAAYLRPEDQGKAGRIVQEIGTYALPSAGLTQMMVNTGKAIANIPKLANAIKPGMKELGKYSGMFSNMLIQTAKDPKAAHALDQTLSALMASAGQASTEAGLSPMERAVVELTVGLGSAGVPAAVNKGKQLMMMSKSGIKTLSDHAVGKYLNDVAAADPDFWKMYHQNYKLAKNYGVKMDLPELSKNPELKAAKRQLMEHGQGGSTTELTTGKEQARQIRQAFDYDTRSTKTALKSIDNEIADITKGLENTVKSAEAKAVKEAVPFKESSLKEAGNAASIRLDEAADLVKKKLGKVYAKVGYDTPVEINLIQDGINTAKKSALPKNEWRGEMPEQLKNVMESLAKKQTAPRELSVAMGAKKQPPKTITLKGVQELQGQIKEEIRAARALGKNQLVKGLSEVLDSTYKQLDNVKGLSPEKATALKAANRQAQISHEKFDEARVAILNKVDKQGLVKTASEDVIKNVIKADSQANSVRGVEAYQNAVGDPKKAKEVLRNGFIAKLAANSLNKPVVSSGDNILNPKATQNFLNRHKNFLKTSGLADEFTDPAAAAKALEGAEETLQTTVNQLAKSELGKWVNADDVIGHIQKLIKSGKIKSLLMETKGKHLVQRGIREAAWEGVLRETKVAGGMRNFEADVSIESIRNALHKNSKDLRLALGEEHFQHTKDLLQIADSIMEKASTTAGWVTEREIENLTEKLLTGLRAAAHGFVRPELIVAQAGKRVVGKAHLEQSKKTLIEVLVNPELAAKYIKLYRSGKPGKAFVNATLAPVAMTVVKADEDNP